MRLFECDKGWEKGWILREFGAAPLKAYVNIYGLSQAAGVITEAVLYRGSRMENAEHMSMSGLLAGEHFPTTLLHGISRALPLETNVLRLI